MRRTYVDQAFLIVVEREIVDEAVEGFRVARTGRRMQPHRPECRSRQFRSDLQIVDRSG
jgi:hypothetical protein